MFSKWMSSGEPKVRLATIQAVGSVSTYKRVKGRGKGNMGSGSEGRDYRAPFV
jgi:hypothetical protein